MKKNRTLHVSSMMPLLLAVVLFVAWVAQAEIPLMLNHQGVIKVGATPFNGTGHFRFAVYSPGANQNLWTNDGSTTGIPDMPDNAVAIPVSDGLYSVGIGNASLSNMSALSSQVFNGSENDLVLRVWFDDQSTVDEVQMLAPDQPLSSVAYAYHAGNADMLGGRNASEYVRGDDGYMTYCLVEHSSTDAAMEIVNTSSGAGTALYAGADGEESKAIDAMAGGNESIGVKTRSTGVNGTGLYAEANDANGRGVYAGSSGVNGTGFYASVSGASGRGIYTEASGATAKAVHGLATSSATGTNYGGQFEARGSTGRGVHAKATGSSGRGLYAEASGIHGRGVYSEVMGENAIAFEGFSGGANGYGALLSNDESGTNVELAGPDNAGNFQGDLVTTDDYKYHNPRTYERQITVFEFQAISGGYFDLEEPILRSAGYYGSSYLDELNEIFLVAPVSLPQGALITKFQVYYLDDHSSKYIIIKADLRIRSLAASATSDLAVIDFSSQAIGDDDAVRTAQTTVINAPQLINNRAYQYWIYVEVDFDLATRDIRFYGASIEYTMDTVSP